MRRARVHQAASEKPGTLPVFSARSHRQPISNGHVSPFQKLIAHSSDCKASKIPSSNQNWKPSNFALIAADETFRGISCPRVTEPTMIKSEAPADCRKTRSDALSTSGIAANNSSRTAMASCSACRDSFFLLTPCGRPTSHSSGGRAIHSHSATSPRHSNRSNRSRARDSSPNRSCLCIARPKSAISQKNLIASPRNAAPKPIETQARKWNGNRFGSGRHKSGQAPFRAYSSARRRALFAINWTRRRVREEQCR
jgi:hypothetical protein